MKIGIPGWKVGDHSFGVTTPYLEYIRFLGADPKILFMGEYDPEVEMLLLPGGSDVDPQRYGQIPSVANSKANPQLEYFDLNILPYYIENKVPIFGICRGMQSLTVAMGGSLDQDMKGLHHHGFSTKHRGEEVNKIKIDENISHPFRSYLRDLINPPRNTKYEEDVNSIHHQCVIDPGDMEELAHEQDGTIEAVHHPDLPIAGVQYHPEELVSDEWLSIAIIHNLLNFGTEDYIFPVELENEKLDAS